MAVTGLNPYDLSKLLSGPCRVLRGDPSSLSIPADLLDIMAVEKADSYAAARGWTDFGATTEGTAYGRQIETSGYEIENTSGSVAESVTDVVRQVSVTMGEIEENALQILEQAPAVDDVAGNADRRPEKHVKFGSIDSLSRYRIAFLGRRPVGVGADVIEQDGTVRGAFVCGVLYTSSITADQAAIQLAKGQLASAPLTFKAFPEDGEEQGEETGLWIVEEPGEIGGS